MVLEEIGRLFQPAKEEKAEKQEKPPQPEASAEFEQLRLREAVLRLLVSRYSLEISENEEKTIPELKAMINPKDKTVQELRAKILSAVLLDKADKSGRVEEYSFSDDFLLAAEHCFAFARSLKQIRAGLPVSFWLSMKEIVELQAADTLDRAILLCNLLRSFGGNSKVRMLELDNGLMHPVVVLTFRDAAYVLDSCQQSSALSTYSGDLKDALSRFEYDGGKYAKSNYEFDDQEYAEF